MADEHHEEVHFHPAADHARPLENRGDVPLPSFQEGGTGVVQEDRAPGFPPGSLCSLLLCTHSEARVEYFGLPQEREERSNLLRDDRQYVVEVQGADNKGEHKLLHS